MSVVSTDDVRTTAPAAATFPWWHRTSLTARLVATVCATIALALALSGALTFPVLRGVMESQKVSELRGVVSGLDGGGIGLGMDTPPSSYYVMVRDASGQVTQDLPNFTDARPNAQQILAHPVSEQTSEFRVDSEGHGAQWIVVARVDHGRRGELRAIYIAYPLEEVNKTLAKYGLGVLGLSVVVLPLAGMVGAFAVRRSLRPLRDVEEVTTAFGGGDTSRRVVGLWPESEVGRVGTSVNSMLDQIEAELAAREASEAKMRQFVGDASHELRTPLAAVRGFAELYRMGAVQTPEDITSTMRRIEDESKRMGGLVEDLLLLARMDEQRPMQLTTVDLARLARDASQDAHALAPSRTVSLLDLDGHPATKQPAMVVADEAHLRQVVMNLVGNAIRHTPDGTPIEIQVGERDGYAVFRVVDHGAGIPPEQAAKVFERFFRADASRSRATGGGSGLGLAIVAAIVKAHHGTVKVLATPGGGATFELAVPQVGAGTQGPPRIDPAKSQLSTMT